jgi:hypothetical protein
MGVRMMDLLGNSLNNAESGADEEVEVLLSTFDTRIRSSADSPR